ncbi:MAG: hypothetical protein RBS02_15960 [Steroidobacteraceae bacterium]|jgi:hypothetical protein|nr:hypothetical protein [Steroidobacteraceae bacterium]
MLLRLIGADGHIDELELGGYEDLFRHVDVGRQRTLASREAIGNPGSQVLTGMLVDDHVVYRLLKKLDDAGPTEFSKCYKQGVRALLEYFATVDGSFDLTERQYIEDQQE